MMMEGREDIQQIMFINVIGDDLEGREFVDFQLLSPDHDYRHLDISYVCVFFFHGCIY
jgi:hypothetical protein